MDFFKINNIFCHKTTSEISDLVTLKKVGSSKFFLLVSTGS